MGRSLWNRIYGGYHAAKRELRSATAEDRVFKSNNSERRRKGKSYLTRRQFNYRVRRGISIDS